MNKTNSSSPGRTACKWLARGTTLGLASYAGMTWLRYGKSKSPPAGSKADALLDTFMPAYEVADKHAVRRKGGCAGTDLGNDLLCRIGSQTRHLRQPLDLVLIGTKQVGYLL
jgi:hypothetical protein